MPVHVHPYVLLPLTACIASAMLTVAVLGRDGGHRANRVAATLTLGATIWSFCEVLWNTADEPATVLRLVRASALGWVALGPLGLHLLLEVTGRDTRRTRRLLPALYAVSGCFLVVAWTTDWMHTGVLRTHWGWGYEFGPAYPFFYAFTTGCLGGGLVTALRHFRDTPSLAERSQAVWIMVGVLVPLVTASLTDGILPMLGVQLPRVGTASFTVLGASVLWSFYRYGYTLLAPGAFAGEILATLPDGVALLRLDGRIRTANAGLARLLGVAVETLPGTPIEAFLHGANLDPRAPVSNVECELRRRASDAMPVAVSTSVLRDKQGLPLGLVLVVRDLREVAALRSRLVTSGRLAAVGELAAGVAHEINNPIAFVRANLGSFDGALTEFEADLPPAAASRASLREARELVAESLEGVDRVSAIVRDIRGFAHQGTGLREETDLPELLDAVLRVASPQLPDDTTVERDYGECPPVSVAPQELKQVFLNLVVNAVQAMESGGRLRVATAREADHALVRIEDDGRGIAPEIIDRIFDPFFTTKAVGEGCGLGLAISYQIVRKHGGDVAVQSRPGAGTTFVVRLPAHRPGQLRVG